MENYIVINGNKAELTKEQLKQLGIIEKNPFDRVGENKKYYTITREGKVTTFVEENDIYDKESYEVANYCTDKKLMKQRALHEILNRKLWRFACENGELENEWNGENYHFEVFFDENEQEFKTNYRLRSHTFGPFFRTKGDADKAIEIIKQFITTHPDFVW